MRMAYSIFIALWMTAMVPTWAGETDGGGWRQVSEEKGIVGYARPNARCRIDEIKAVGIVEAPLPVVEAVIRDIPASRDYLFRCKEAYRADIPGERNTADTYVTYCLTDMPLPVSDRDMVARVSWTIDPATGALAVHGEGIKSDYRQAPGVVRMPLVVADYTLVPRGPSRTEVTYQSIADPGGNLPAWVVQLFARNLGVKTIEGLRTMAKLEKYRQATAVVTTTPLKP